MLRDRTPFLTGSYNIFRVTLAIVVLTAVFVGRLAGQVPGLQLPAGSAEVAKHVRIELSPETAEPVRTVRFNLQVTLDIQPGWHLYANPKRGKFGKDTQIEPVAGELVRFGKVAYPPGELYEDKVLEASNHIYEGRVSCSVPVEFVAERLLPSRGDRADSFEVLLQLSGQLCSDSGVCKLWNDTVRATISIDTAAIAAAAAAEPPTETAVKTASSGWLVTIGLALAAGLIMNLMPCVLPIIPIIVMTLMKQCSTDDGRPAHAKSIKIGLVFAAGIMTVFAALAVLVGTFNFFWGEQFQNNIFKFVLLMIVYVLGLSMFGLFEIVLPPRLTNTTIVRRGYIGVFLMGILATILATPCGAPLLGPVLVWLVNKPVLVTVAVFLIIGVGMAAPYVALTAIPGLLNRVPRAGNWMLHLKRILGFAIMAYAGYLIGKFPSGWFIPLLYYCVLAAFCIWMGLNLVNFNTPSVKRYLVRAVALAILIAGALWLFETPKQSAAASDAAEVLTKLREYQQEQKTVVLKFTADWCSNCKVLEKRVYGTQEYRDKLTALNAVLLIADMTEKEPLLEDMLEQLAGPAQGLPLWPFFPGRPRTIPFYCRNYTVWTPP